MFLYCGGVTKYVLLLHEKYIFFIFHAGGSGTLSQLNTLLQSFAYKNINDKYVSPKM